MVGAAYLLALLQLQVLPAHIAQRLALKLLQREGRSGKKERMNDRKKERKSYALKLLQREGKGGGMGLLCCACKRTGVKP